MSFKSLPNAFSKSNYILNTLLFLGSFLISISICKMFFKKEYHIEGFDTQSNNEFNHFYASIYDFVAFDDNKNMFEIKKIIELTQPDVNSVMLDIGSGMGHHVNALNDLYCGDIIGIDKSVDMVNYSKKNYPDISASFHNIDITTGHSFSNQQFSHILCLYFTIYYIDNQKLFLQNCFNWLKNDCFMVLHLVNKDGISTLLNPNYVNGITSNYEPKTTIDFNKFQYTSKFDTSVDSNKVLFKEHFAFKNGNKKLHTHTLNLIDQEVILNYARSAGFIVHGKVNMTDCNYDNHYLYILKKPF
jgi:2-polyprenyl-3-methyl-5-hydroxy-6-metoxy-1,4-benzoquinol methylase